MIYLASEVYAALRSLKWNARNWSIIECALSYSKPLTAHDKYTV